jgi:hypothetical protein
MAAAALIAVGCNEAPTTSSPQELMSKPPASTPANPALTYQGTGNSKGSSYQTVAVMDADGSHQTNLYGSAQTAGQFFMYESWSPTGTSIAFVQTNGSATAPVASIKALDVSVNSSGAAVASNVRTIYNLPANTDVNVGLAWSSTVTMGKIAYATWDPVSSTRTLWVIPQTGGAPIKVWGCDATYVKEDGSVIGHRQPLTSPTWSPDDHMLAAIRADSATTATPYVVSTIMIFSTTDNGGTWSYTDSIKVPGTTGPGVAGLEWSRNASGINKLAYYNAGDWSLYYVSPVTGAVPTTNGVKGRYPAWSPDNGLIIFQNLGGGGNGSSSYLSKIVPFTTNVTNIVPEPADPTVPLVRWKR